MTSPDAARPGARLTVRRIGPAEHLGYLRQCAGASYLQCPSWGRMPPRWRPESVGWFDGPRLLGVGLVLHRDVPLVGSLAYVGEGPVLDWAAVGAEEVTTPLLGFLRARGAFSVKLAPDLVLRRWRLATMRSALRDGRAGRLRDLPADVVEPVAAEVAASLRAQGWRQYEAPGPGFGGTMHPRYRCHVPVAEASGMEGMEGMVGIGGGEGEGRKEGADRRDGLEARLDAAWRRNLRRAAAHDVTVRVGTAADLPVFYRLYAETAARDGFAPLPAEFFDRLWQSLRAEDPARLELYLADRDGQAHSAALRTRVGNAFSYTHGGSSTAGRSWRPSNALQWRMLSDAAAQDAAVYDLRGISDTLDPGDPLFGLLRFKLGLGGDAVEMLGEWDYPLRPVRHRAVAAYLDRRPR